MKVQLTPNSSVGRNSPPYIIAEIGSNHNGDMELARKLIQLAKDCKADCVKFQSWSKESIFSQKKYEDNYFLSDDYRNRDDYSLEEIVEEYSISETELMEMKKFSEEVGIDLISTPFSKPEVDFLVDKLEAPFIKVASMDLNNYSFLEYIARKQKPIVLSTGMGTLSEIDKAISTIESTGNNQLVILHCVSVYPPKDEDNNLKNILTLASIYPYPIGFSDHSLGTSIPAAAVALGACVIEKHFTLDKEMEGWDHKVSADPNDMEILVRDSKRIFKSLGTARIVRTESDERVTEFRRSVVAARNIQTGEIITEEMIDYKRPGGGLEPEAVRMIVGRKARRDIPFDDMIKIDDF